jgi:RecB family endonuclease NucS
MRSDEVREDPIMQALAGLSVNEPDQGRAVRTRARCLAVLDRRRRAEAQSGRITGSLRRRVLEPALVAAASAIYLAEVVRRALQLYGL